MQPQNPNLRRVQDRRAEQRTEHTSVGDGKRPTSQVLYREFALVRLSHIIFDLPLDLGKAQAVRIPDHRHHQPIFRADRHADIVIVLQQDFVTLNLAVHAREGLQGTDSRLDEKRGDPQLDAITRLEVLVAATT